MQNVKETFASKIKELTDLKRKAEEESRCLVPVCMCADL